jgi:hypothetical protein
VVVRRLHRRLLGPSIARRASAFRVVSIGIGRENVLGMSYGLFILILSIFLLVLIIRPGVVSVHFRRIFRLVRIASLLLQFLLLRLG